VPTTIIVGMEPELCPRSIAKDDAAALIGVLAVLQGHALAGDLDGRLVARLSRRAGGPGGSAGLAAALDGLNQRLRYALGEYEASPTEN
jgi:hypothetical protein